LWQPLNQVSTHKKELISLSSKMIGKHGNVEYKVTLKDQAGKEFPEVVHQGVTYSVCTAGQEFTVQVSCKDAHSKVNQKYAADLNIDGKSVGYSKPLGTNGATFPGWWVDHKTKRAFLFSVPQAVQEKADNLNSSTGNPKIGAVEVIFYEYQEYLCPALAGRDCFQCNLLGPGTKTITMAAPEETESIKQVSPCGSIIQLLFLSWWTPSTMRRMRPRA
jgi:hypothetical protein